MTATPEGESNRPPSMILSISSVDLLKITIWLPPLSETKACVSLTAISVGKVNKVSSSLVSVPLPLSVTQMSPVSLSTDMFFGSSNKPDTSKRFSSSPNPFTFLTSTMVSVSVSNQSDNIKTFSSPVIAIASGLSDALALKATRNMFSLSTFITL